MKFDPRISALASLCLVVAACEEASTPTAPESVSTTAVAAGVPASIARAQSSDVAAALAFMDAANAKLELEGKDFRLAGIETLTTGENGHPGVTVFAKDVGNKQLAFDFVPEDPRSPWSPGPGITYAVDQIDGATDDGETNIQTEGAIDAAMATWDVVQCSTLPITKGPNFGLDLGILEFFFTGEGGSPFIVADIMQGGWLTRDLFDQVATDGGDFILGVTFTFAFDPSGDPVGGPPFTDIDGNGKPDASFREIYYNDEFEWGVPGTSGLGSPFDVETVALHEAGHGLSQGHFGKIFVTSGNDGQLHFAPRAVMNAAVTGRNVAIAKTDKAGHCSNWAQWPNN